MSDTVLTLQQALQLVALGPCLFVIFFLLLTGKDKKTILLPVLYFLSLSCSFLEPLTEAVPQLEGEWAQCLILYGESLVPAISFLLILQFLQGRVPPALYWSVLLIPVIGGSYLVMATVTVPESCISNETYCLQPAKVRALYEILSASLIFLLLVVIAHRTQAQLDRQNLHYKHTYWLIVALIATNLALIGIDLGRLSGVLTPEHSELSITVLRLTFIYLMLTSVFRVFDRAIPIDYALIPTAEKYVFRPIDSGLIEKIKKLMEEEKLYREMRLSRDDIAKRLGVGEHVVSRVINAHFGESVTQFVNSYRISEAKSRLSSEDVSITVIAFEAGFNSIASFNRVFKDMAGISPTDYRQSQRMEQPSAG